MPELQNPTSDASVQADTNEGSSSSSGVVISEMVRRKVKYIPMSETDRAVMTFSNTFSTICFSVSSFCIGNIVLSIYIQSLFAASLTEQQKIGLSNLEYGGCTGFIIFLGLGIFFIVFKNRIFGIAQKESE